VKRTARADRGGTLGGLGGGGVDGLEGEVPDPDWEGLCEGGGVGSLSTAISSCGQAGERVRQPRSVRVWASAAEQDLRISDF
jgi:hypothetical protein